MKRQKAEVITFKAPGDLVEALEGVSNRSEFIRSALLAAMRNTCPLCRGSGTLTPKQREHWDLFARTHEIVKCDECHELHITCSTAAKGG